MDVNQWGVEEELCTLRNDQLYVNVIALHHLNDSQNTSAHPMYHTRTLNLFIVAWEYWKWVHL